MTIHDQDSQETGTKQTADQEVRLPILGIIEGLERVCRSDASVDAFAAEMVRGFVAVSNAGYGAFWMAEEPAGSLRVVCELLPQVSKEALDGWRQGLAQLAASVIQLSIIRSRGLVEQAGGAAAEARHVAIGFPVGVQNAERGCVTVVIQHDNPILRDTGIAFMRLLASLGLVYDSFQAAAKHEGSYRSLSTAWDVLGEAMAFTKPVEMAQVLANSTRRSFHAERASVGFVKRQKVEVAAISGEDTIDKRSNIVRLIQAVQTEIAISGEPGSFRETDDAGARAEQLTRNPQHERLATHAGARAVYSVPMRKEQDLVAVLTLEFGDEPLSELTLRLADVTAGQAGPMLHLALQNERGIIKRVRDGAEAAATWVFGREHPWRKVGLAAGVALVLFAVFGRVGFTVSGNCVLRPALRRIYAAPFDATIKAAFTRPGDTLTKGDSIFELDREEMRLRLREAKSKRISAEKEMGTYLAEQRMSQYAEAKARMNALSAEIELIEQQIARSLVRAEFPGIVISGDLRQDIGRPVRMGEELVEVAPLKQFVLEVQVDQGDVGYLQEGQPGSFTTKARPDVSIDLELSKVRPMPEVRDGSNVYVAEAVILNRDGWLRPGMEGAAKVSIGRRNVVWAYTRKIINWIRFHVWW